MDGIKESTFVPPKTIAADLLEQLGLNILEVNDPKYVGFLVQMDVDNYEEESGTPDDHMTDWYPTDDFLNAINRGDFIIALEIAKELGRYDHPWAGCVWGEKQDDVLHIHNLITAVAYRGRDLSTRMMLMAVEYALKNGCTKIGADVDPLNRVGLTGYFQLGGRITGYKPGPDQYLNLNEWVEMEGSITGEEPDLDYDDVVEIETGDEEGLKRAIMDEHRIGFEHIPDPDNDPCKGIIKFAKPL